MKNLISLNNLLLALNRNIKSSEHFKFGLTLCFVLFSLIIGSATQHVVSLTSDAAVGPTLRNQIVTATSGDTIVFDISINGDTIKLDSAIVINKDLLIIGNDTTNTIIDGQNKDRIFEITATVNLQRMRIIKGKVTESEEGGAIYAEDDLMIIDCIFMLNSSEDNGGAIYSSGFSTSLTVLNSLFKQNSAGRGGAVYQNSGSSNNSSFTNSIFKNNIAGFGGAIYTRGNTAAFTKCILNQNTANGSGGAITSDTDLILRNCMIKGNSSFSAAGAIDHGSETLRAYNTIISGNITTEISGAGGGIVLGTDGIAQFTNCTITGNKCEKTGNGFCRGGGISMFGDTEVTLTNTIVAKNTDVNAVSSSRGPELYRWDEETAIIIDGGNNIIGDTFGLENVFNISTLKGGSGVNIFDPFFIMDSPGAPSIEGDFNLSDSSKAINAGRVDTSGLSIGSIDLADSMRISRDTVDIGAYEFQFPFISNPNNDCSQDTITITNTLISSSGDSTYKAIKAIITDANFDDFGDFTLNAGTSVLLSPNFNVPINTVMNIDITPCMQAIRNNEQMELETNNK